MNISLFATYAHFSVSVVFCVLFCFHFLHLTAIRFASALTQLSHTIRTLNTYIIYELGLNTNLNIPSQAYEHRTNAFTYGYSGNDCVWIECTENSPKLATVNKCDDDVNATKQEC